MSTFITASINLNKIDKAKIIKGEKGQYLNLVIYVKDEANQFGKDVSIEQSVQKGDTKIFLGDGKVYKPKSDVVQPKQSEDLPEDNTPDWLK